MKKTVVLDTANQSLTIDSVRVHLSPKAFSVLDYLYQHYQQLVTKEDLLNAVWPNVIVTDAVLKVAVGELRKALGDPPKQPIYIETVHRRGYRFIGELAQSNHSVPRTVRQNVIPLFGRDEALQKLGDTWSLAEQGDKQILFVCAEAGLGKTFLLNTWLEQHCSDQSSCFLARAECLDQYGRSEPYLPIFNILGSLLKTPQRAIVQTVLRQYAPGWYLQIPELLQADEEQVLKQEVFGATSQRVLREFVDFISALSQEMPVLLCIEDLHWCDNSSLDLIMGLVQHSGIGRLMLIASLRPSSLQQEKNAVQAAYSQILLQQQGEVLELTEIDTESAQHWLEQHLPEVLREDSYIELLCRYTAGNPLLISTALEHLQNSLPLSAPPTETHTQDNITLEWVEEIISGGFKKLLNLRVVQLEKEELQLLEAASVSAYSFSTESVAAVLQSDVLELEEICEGSLLHERWLSPTGSENWPDGSISECYQFWHQLYRSYFYEKLSAARCRHYHLRFAERLLAGYQSQLEERAAQLAYHFEAGGNLQQAIHFGLMASEQAKHYFAYDEAIVHIRKVMVLADKRSDLTTQLEAHQKLCALLLANGKLLETVDEYKALIKESHDAGALVCEVDATLGLADTLFWIDRQACLEMGKQAVTLSEKSDDSSMRIHAQGKYTHHRSVINGYQPDYAQDYEAAFKLAEASADPALQCVHYSRYLYYLIIRSHYQEASELAMKTMALAMSTGNAISYLTCEFFHAWALFYQGRWDEMLIVMNRSMSLAGKNGHLPWVLHFQLQKAWLLVQIGDYAAARALCAPIYEQVRSKPPSSLYFFSLIILIRLETASEQLEVSQHYVTEILTTLDEKPSAIDWVLRLSLLQVLAEYWLQQNDLLKANEAAQVLKTLSACSGERTYQVVAEVLLAQCNSQKEQYLANASKIAQSSALPTIAWKLHSMQQDQAQREKVINELLDNLASEPELQACFKQTTEKVT